MGNKSLELDYLLRDLSLDQVSALHFYRGNEKFKDFVSVLNHVIKLDQLKTVGLVSDVNSVDEAVKTVSKQNFYRGRINLAVLLHGLMKNAEEELERREAKSKK